MTATYDPTDPKYFDPAALRDEVDRVFDLCHGCRLCFNLCPSFPTLFDFIDAKDGDVAALTDAERDQVVDECYQCKLCYVKCPYVPPHEWELDFPRLMMRVHAVRKKQGVGVKERRHRPVPRPAPTRWARCRCAAAPVVNWATGTPGSLARRVMEKTVGLAVGAAAAALRQAALHHLVQEAAGAGDCDAGTQAGRCRCSRPASSSTWTPTSARTWWRSTSTTGWRARCPRARSAAARRGCTRATSRSSTKAARRNVAALAAEVRAGRDIIVAQPTCAYVVKRDYPIYAEGRRRRPGGGAHLRPGRVPDATPPRRAATPSRCATEFPGRDDGTVPDDGDLPRGLPPAGPERRAARAGTC